MWDFYNWLSYYVNITLKKKNISYDIYQALKERLK